MTDARMPGVRRCSTPAVAWIAVSASRSSGTASASECGRLNRPTDARVVQPPPSRSSVAMRGCGTVASMCVK